MVQYLHFRILKFSLTWWTLPDLWSYDQGSFRQSNMPPLHVAPPCFRAGWLQMPQHAADLNHFSIYIIHHDHIYGGFLKRGYLQIIHSKRIFQNNTSILGYHHLWKPPCMFTIFPCETSVRSTLFFQVVLEVVAMLSAEAVQELLAIRSRRNDVWR